MSVTSCFRYEIGGKLTPTDDPTTGAPEDEEFCQTLSRIGYNHLDTMGNTCGFNMEIYGSSEPGDQQWALAISDGFLDCLIVILGWPAFLDALRHYSPILSMSQGEMTITELRKLIQA